MDSDHIKALVIIGTRPEAVKMAPLITLLKASEKVEPRLCVTAQHREMLDQVLQIFSLEPDYDLNIMQEGQSLGEITCRSLHGLEKVLAQEQFQLVLVHGDTTTTFAGSLAAFYHRIALGHVEAGLRTGNKHEPFPEEINRRLTGCLADLHFAPTERARNNLLKEGITNDSIYVTGNTVIDALKYTVRQNYRFKTPGLNEAVTKGTKLLVVECHRRENWGEPMQAMLRGLRRVIEENKDLTVVFPVHRNPKVQDPVFNTLKGLEQVLLVEPLDTDEFHNLMARCYFIVTDSGGIQEEAPSLGKPVLVLRRVTERPEAVEAGTVKLIGTEEEGVYQGITKLLRDESLYKKMATAVNPYGDGKACQRIYSAILYYFKLSQSAPAQFR